MCPTSAAKAAKDEEAAESSGDNVDLGRPPSTKKPTKVLKAVLHRIMRQTVAATNDMPENMAWPDFVIINYPKGSEKEAQAKLRQIDHDLKTALKASIKRLNKSKNTTPPARIIVCKDFSLWQSCEEVLAVRSKPFSYSIFNADCTANNIYLHVSDVSTKIKKVRKWMNVCGVCVGVCVSVCACM